MIHNSSGMDHSSCNNELVFIHSANTFEPHMPGTGSKHTRTTSQQCDEKQTLMCWEGEGLI